MLAMRARGADELQTDTGTTSAEYGTGCTPNTTANTKATSYTQLIASTSFDSFGIFVMLNGGAIASTNKAYLVDIAIGGVGSEQIIIPNLMGGQQAASATTSMGGSMYFFPIMIPAGSRISARSQCSAGTGSAISVKVHLLQHRIPGQWYGQRVTAYGVNTANSSGTSMSPGNNAYATDVNLTASTTNPIRALQIGCDLLTNNAGTTSRGLIRVTADNTILAAGLPYGESTTLETTLFTPANFILSQMRFSEPAGIALKISAMRSTTAATRGWAAYGVD
jgi:hypothetical protein